MRLKWTRSALGDLASINKWLTGEASGQTAVRILAEIRHRARFLENFPHGGRPDKSGVRVLLVFNTPYLILYRIVGEDVEILRVRHQREDWQVET